MIVETDAYGRAILSGYPNRWFLMQANEDGSILLRPADTQPDGQRKFDAKPKLQDLVSLAAASPTVRRTPKHR